MSYPENLLRITHEKSRLILERLTSFSEVRQAMDYLKEDNAAAAEEQIRITERAAPSFQEEHRAAWMADRFKALGLDEVTIDAEGNVLGEFKGEHETPNVVLSAHLDTVFPAGTRVQAKISSGVIYAPGISDDGRGLAALLTIIRSLKHSGMKPLHSLLFVATVS